MRSTLAMLLLLLTAPPAPAEGLGSCWQCMHGCQGRDSEVCSPLATKAKAKVSTKGLSDAFKEYDSGSWPSDDYDIYWGKVMREFHKLQRAIKEECR